MKDTVVLSLSHAKSELTSQIDAPERSAFFLSFNDKYQNISSYGIWYKLPKIELTQEEIDGFLAFICQNFLL